ncbi:hypothetical protein [Bacillus sp. AG4(2022)]|uniref:hypothetical protein n=1 Tax=Bacillus sp. AG4(2022) TaxID=2962594 RepID=UPI0028810D82|nr:hypothetical protein [Bacillus sp. AG4(2022)]MDT0159259.1 hypothetical protein [Bacillus sp. AG4(2022)]
MKKVWLIFTYLQRQTLSTLRVTLKAKFKGIEKRKRDGDWFEFAKEDVKYAKSNYPDFNLTNASM